MPGILIIAFGRSTRAQSRSACTIVPSVSCASVGATSSETVPSPWPLASYTGRKTSHAACTSATISDSTISAVVAPREARTRMSAS
ncbi:MAG: hypothetical protein V9E87_08265 [Gemmatimonadales bacterium]